MLHNRVNNRTLKENLKSLQEERITLSFYRYHPIDDPADFRNAFYEKLHSVGTLGRIYVAREGVNAQVSVARAQQQAFVTALESFPFLKGVRLNTAIDDNGKSFFKLKILVRKKIVADGLPDGTFDIKNGGIHLNAREFNALTDHPETVIVDMRNHYESEVGHFRNAICPDVDTFREELKVVESMLHDKREKNIVMYCTGGIRCEKASAWMKHRGFDNVYQLDGGIIEYTRQVIEQGLENKFVGKNFVFDERLGERITHEVISHCHQCGAPCDDHTNCRNDGCHLLFIQCATCAAKFEGCCSAECQQVLTLSPEQQKELRKGINKGRQVFKKGRSKHLLSVT